MFILRFVISKMAMRNVRNALEAFLECDTGSGTCIHGTAFFCNNRPCLPMGGKALLDFPRFFFFFSRRLDLFAIPKYFFFLIF